MTRTRNPTAAQKRIEAALKRAYGAGFHRGFTISKREVIDTELAGIMKQGFKAFLDRETKRTT